MFNVVQKNITCKSNADPIVVTHLELWKNKGTRTKEKIKKAAISCAPWGLFLRNAKHSRLLFFIRVVFVVDMR